MATQAKMGFVGFVRFKPTEGSGYNSTLIPNTGITVRVTSADIKLSQEISYPDVVDNKIDQTIYQLGPAVVGGTIQFPLVHEGANVGNLYGKSACVDENAASLVQSLWKIVADRDEVGRMKHAFDCHVRYADNLAYKYYGCLVNQMTFTINQSEPVQVSAEVIGGATSPVSGGTGVGSLRGEMTPDASTDLTKMLAPARIVTWNDAIISFWRENVDNSDTAGFLTAAEIRQFTCTVNNNIERFYTLNGRLGPQDIAAKKRELSGTLDIMGHNNKLSLWTASNEDRFTAPSGIAFGYKLGNNDPGHAYWATGLFGVVFEIEEVALSTGLFETKTKWRALGDCTNSYLATKLGGTNVNLPLTRDSDFGVGITGAYPAFRTNNTP